MAEGGGGRRRGGGGRGRGRGGRGRGGRSRSGKGVGGSTEPKMFPHIFHWDGGGSGVLLVGSFNNWTPIPMVESLLPGGGVSVEVKLPVGIHNYLFRVDGVYKTDPSNLILTDKGHNQVIISDEFVQEMPAFGEDMDIDPANGMDDQSSESSEVTSVYSASSDTPGGEPSVQLMFKFPVAASGFIDDHLKVHGCSDFIVEYKPLSSNSARITVPKSEGFGVMSNLNGSKVDGKYKLTVEPYRSHTGAHAAKATDSSHLVTSKDENCTLYVGSKLPEYTNEQHFRDHFGMFASAITKIELIRDKSTKIFKGFAFITFSSHEVARTAMTALNRSTLLGMQVQVNFDQRKVMLGVPQKGLNVSATSNPEEETSDSESVASESVYSDSIKVVVHTRPKLPSSCSNTAFRKHFKHFQSDMANAFICRDRKTKESRGFGFIFFSSLKAAEYAVEKMKGTKVQDKFEIISIGITKDKKRSVSKTTASPVKLQTSPGKDQAFFPPTVAGVSSPDNIAGALSLLSLNQPTPQDSVIIENMNPEFTESTIQSLVQVPMLSCRRDSSNVLFVKCHSNTDAKKVVGNLNDKVILGQKITACLAPISRSSVPEFQRAISTMSVDSDVSCLSSPPNMRSVKVTHISRNVTKAHLYQHFRSIGEIAGEPVLIDNKKSPFLYAYINFHNHQSALEALKLDKSCLCGINITVKLSGNKASQSSDNTIVDSHYTAQPDGEIPENDYKSFIALDPEQWNTLMQVNTDTRSSFFKEIKEPFKTNRDVKFQPDFENNRIELTGKRDVVEHAKDYISKQIMKKDIPIERSKMEALCHLMPTLSHEVLQYGVQMIGFTPGSTLIRFDGSQTGIKNAYDKVKDISDRLNSEKVQLQDSYQHNELEDVKKAISTKPYAGKIYMSTSPDILSKNVLMVWCFDRNILKQSVLEIQQLLSVSKLGCSSEEAVYIKHFCTNSISRLPLKVEFIDGEVYLKGTSEEVKQSKAFFQSIVLNGLLCKKYPFSCKVKFKEQIEECVLQRYSAEETSFKYLTIKEKQGKKQSEIKRDGMHTFDLYIFCTNKEFFMKVCIFFDQVSPSSKPYSVTQDGVETIISEMKGDLESKYFVRLYKNAKSSSYRIDALIPAELQKCLGDIKEQVEEKVITTKYINISESLCSLLKLYKDDMNEIKKSCGITILYKGSGHENCAIRLKGAIRQVNDVQASLSHLLDMNVIEDSCVLHCPTSLFNMWLKRWNQVKEQEEKTKTYISFSRKPSEDDSKIVPVRFDIIGSDETCVSDVKQAILAEGVNTEEKVFSLSPSGTNCLLSARRDKKLGEIIKDIVFVQQIDKQHNKVTIVAPKELSEYLESAEEQVRKFVGERASTSHVLCSKDPVVSLILSNATKSMDYIARANSISRQHNVSVIVQKKPVGLRLSGTESALSVVKPLIQSVIMDSIEKGIGEIKMNIEAIYKPLLKSPVFLQFEAKLGNELCVSCSYPKPGKASKLIGCSELTTDTPGQVIKVDICKGDLVFEQTEAIVNAANEDLKHIGGLAKAIAEGGGPNIQKESNEYIATHKKVPSGKAVCLGSGDLPCKRLIHAVSPRWEGGNSSEEQTLYFTVFESLKVASTEQVTSVAFPALGTGVYGVPEGVCACMSLKAVRDFFQSNSMTTITNVKFVLYNQSTVNAFMSEIKSSMCGRYKLQDKRGSHIPDLCKAQLPQLSSASSSSWQWMNDQGGFTSYSPSQCLQLETAYKSNPSGGLNLTIADKNYQIDFRQMRQINLQTGGARAVQNNPGILSNRLSSIQWEYQDGRKFLPYTASDSILIEKMYCDKMCGQLVINGTTYVIDPVQKTQTNSVTTYKRNIRRQTIEASSSPSVQVSEVSESYEQSSADDSVTSGHSANLQDDGIIMTLRGPHEVLSLAKDRLKAELKKSISNPSFDKFPKGITADFEKKLGHIASKNSLLFSFEDIQGSDGKIKRVMHLKGVYFKCRAAMEAIQEEVLSFHLLAASSEDVEFPQEWQTQTKTTERFVLQQGSSEWSRVSSKFTSTMSGQRIIEISRIQNKWLWEKYIGHKKRLDRKNSGNVNEMELFHGTRSNDPKNIYEGEEGFDMRFSAQGMWGMANYFAVNANYSHAYSYGSTSGRQMFLVKVLTGDSYECQSDRSLRMPPVKAPGISTGEIQFVNIRYDTVSGYTGGSRVYMTYDNDKAYPAYLITYQ